MTEQELFKHRENLITTEYGKLPYILPPLSVAYYFYKEKYICKSYITELSNWNHRLFAFYAQYHIHNNEPWSSANLYDEVWITIQNPEGHFKTIHSYKDSHDFYFTDTNPLLHKAINLIIKLSRFFCYVSSSNYRKRIK